MTGLALLALQFLGPSVLGGSLGAVLAVVKSPLTSKVLTVAKRMGRGEHLSDEDKQIARAYRQQRSQQERLFGWR